MPRMRIFDASALKDVQRMGAFHLGAFRAGRTLKALDGGSLRLVANFAPPMSANVAPSSVSGEERGLHPTRVTSDAATCTPSGGAGPFTYSWVIISGDTSIDIDSPTNATTTFSKVLFNDTAAATARCTVTDSLGTSAFDDAGIVLSMFDN